MRDLAAKATPGDMGVYGTLLKERDAEIEHLLGELTDQTLIEEEVERLRSEFAEMQHQQEDGLEKTK